MASVATGVFATLLLLAGCRTGRSLLAPAPLPAAFPHHSVDDIRRALHTATDTLHSLKAVSSAAVASPEGSSQFTAVVNHRRGDSVRVDVKVQFGIEAARILFTPDSVFVYDRIKKTVYYGDTESASGFLMMPWRTPDLFFDVLGLPAVEIDDTWSVQADSARYYLTSMDSRRKLFVDPTIWRIVRTEVRDTLGAIEEERTFLDFELFSGVALPRRIVVRRPGDRISATISHRSLTLNPEHLDLDFRVPNNARYVRVY